MKQTNNILIVGGGTAGWLSAAKLAKELGANQEDGVKVTLLESSDIPTIGVGEGTWPTMRKTLASLGIDESEFIVQTEASFKQATKFVNWRNEASDQDNVYYHLFSSASDSAEFNLAPYWLLGDRQNNYAESISAQGILCEQGLAPKLITNRQYEGIQNYAYHLDAGKFAALLKRHCVEKLGVTHLIGNVVQVNTNSNGEIDSVATDCHGVIKADLYVDCTGFKSLLLGEALGVKYHSISDKLFIDTAIAIQMPYENDQSPISSSTISTAQDAGWIWDIGLQSRRGTGHVFCSKYMSSDEAEHTLREYLGPLAKDLPAKYIPMDCGYREKFWHKNCVAIGLSAAFVEPLEASAIFLIEASANMLAELFPRNQALMELSADKYNESFSFRWKRTIDFIKLHYILSKRNGQFWLDNKNVDTIPQSLSDSLEQWRYRPVSKYDFENVFEPFPQDSYQYVLYGMGYEPELGFCKSKYANYDVAARLFAQTRDLKNKLAENLDTNRKLLEKVKTYGFQKL
ncbi:tryptophan halogenase family protein [Pseudoalteromonas sp. T1lg65]|uniref:tryptophan halogenase family protein n=1 Tax=Pseudoalteromonas sp. T1lg65 TaxID=2077101 RepID=UPI003F78F676